jgi:DeoR family fructose operon transcriptional repressor
VTMYAEERQQAIARLVNQRGRMSVNQLAREYDVTTETVRRDLSTLERMGLVRRVHGGVVPPASLSLIESGIRERDQVNIEIKERIARAALDHLPPPGGTIVIDAGSTTGRLASLLPPDHELTVVTHAVPIAARLAGQRQIDLRLLPGRVRRTTQAAVGADTVAALSPHRGRPRGLLEVRHRDRHPLRRARRDRRPRHRQGRLDRRPPGAHQDRDRGRRRMNPPGPRS